MVNEDLNDITTAPNEAVQLERLTHHIQRIRERQDEMLKGQEELRRSLAEMAAAITRLTLVEERQSVTSTAIERLSAAIEKIDERLSTSVEKIDERLRKLEAAEPIQAKTAEWVQSALWAAAAAVAMFIAGRTGLF